MKQHNYEVTLLVSVIVCNAESEEDARKGAIDLIIDEPCEYREEFKVIKVEDFGESKIQY